MNAPQKKQRNTLGILVQSTRGWGFRPELLSFRLLLTVRSRISFVVLLLIITSSVRNLAFAVETHPISVTEAQVFVSRNTARMRISLFAEDLYLFHNLKAGDQDRIPPSELQRGLKAHRNFLLEKVTLRGASGDAYEGRVTDVAPFEIPDDGIPVEDLMQFKATYELEFPFETAPEFLTMQQDISDENFIFPSEMKLVLHQAGTELTYTENLRPGDPKTVRFDWSNNVPTEDNTEEEWAEWFERQREETLGITSYSSVYSFIYIEPAEVRHEVLIPLANLKTVLPLKHADPAFVTVEEQDGVRELLREWLSADNPAFVNKQRIAPEFTRIDFYGLDLKDFAKQAKQRPVSLANGRVGLILTYRPESGSVSELSLQWDKFNSAMRKIRSVVSTWPDGLERFEFSRFNTPEENTLEWTMPASARPEPAVRIRAEPPAIPRMRLPVGTIIFVILAIAVGVFSKSASFRIPVALVVIGLMTLPFVAVEIDHPWKSPPAVSPEGAAKIFAGLHSTTYSALERGSRDAIYEALETSIGDDLLETVYLQLRESLKVQEQGGAVARVRSVEHLDGERQDRPDPPWPGFAYRSCWKVSGTVEHWGHIHERQNQFTAVFDVEPRDGFWKITSMQIEEQESLASNTRLRSF